MRKSSLRSPSGWASALVPWVGFAAALGGAGPALARHIAAPPAAKPALTDDALAEEAGLRPTRLLVDFRDDVSPEALRATGYREVPLSDYSKVDGLYTIDFADADAAAAARARLARDPTSRASTTTRWPPFRRTRRCRRSTAETTGSLEAECGAKTVKRPVTMAATTPRASPTTPASSTSGTCARSECRPPGSRGTARGRWSPSSTRASPRSAIWPTPSSSPATTSSPTTPTPPTTTATARTSPGRSPSRPTTRSGWPASPTARPSCRSRCCRRAARGRWAASRRRSAGPPTTAPTSST